MSLSNWFPTRRQDGGVIHKGWNVQCLLGQWLNCPTRHWTFQLMKMRPIHCLHMFITKNPVK